MTQNNHVLHGQSDAVPQMPHLSSAPLHYPKAPYAWFVVFFLLIAYMVALVDRQILALLVQPVRADLNISDTQLSLLVGFAFILFYSTLGLVFGRLADRKNRRNMIIIGMLLWSAATMGCGLANNFQELFVGRMLVGVGEAVLSPCAYSMIADYFPKERRSRAAGVYTMGAFVGGGAAFIFGGAAVDMTANWDGFILPLIGQVKGWQAVFMLVGMPGIIVAVMMLLVKEPVRQESTGQYATLSDLFAFLRQNTKTVVLIVIGFAMCGLVSIGLMSWVPAMFIRLFGWTAGEIGLAFGCILILAGGAGASAGGIWVSRSSVAGSRLAVLHTARTSFLAMPPLVIVIGLGQDPILVLAALAGVIFFTAVVGGLAPVAVYEIAPQELRAQLISMYLMAGTLIPYGLGIVLIAATTDYIFQSDLAVGKSLAIVLFIGSLVGAFCLNSAAKQRQALEA